MSDIVISAKKFRQGQQIWQSAIESCEPAGRFEVDEHDHNRHISRVCYLAEGEWIEKASICYSHLSGDQLPAAALPQTASLAGQSFEVTGLSMIVHPRNPNCPSMHANVRHFVAGCGESQQSWFGGGMDLTPYFGFVEDAQDWHQTARTICEAGGYIEQYEQFKQSCDRYFYLPHRQEHRGIGGIFFDRLAATGQQSKPEQLVTALIRQLMPVYVMILRRRAILSYDQAQRDFMCYRRGRYVEFNLLYDRGTKFGLAHGSRIAPILSSLPPAVYWSYQPSTQALEWERNLCEHYLTPRSWLTEGVG